MNEQLPTSRISKRTKALGALGMATGLAFGAGALLDQPDKKPAIYQPAVLTPNSGGYEVPAGEQAPVGEAIVPVPGHPDEEIIHYGTSPDGQTLPDKLIHIPTMPTPSSHK